MDALRALDDEEVRPFDRDEDPLRPWLPELLREMDFAIVCGFVVFVLDRSSCSMHLRTVFQINGAARVRYVRKACCGFSCSLYRDTVMTCYASFWTMICRLFDLNFFGHSDQNTSLNTGTLRPDDHGEGASSKEQIADPQQKKNEIHPRGTVQKGTVGKGWQGRQGVWRTPVPLRRARVARRKGHSKGPDAKRGAFTPFRPHPFRYMDRVQCPDDVLVHGSPIHLSCCFLFKLLIVLRCFARSIGDLGKSTEQQRCVRAEDRVAGIMWAHGRMS